LGNKTGWIAAGVLGGAVLLYALFTIFAPFPSAPNHTAVRGFMDLHVPSTPLSAILPAVPSEGGNAADDYEKALTRYKQVREVIDGTADIERVNTATAASDPWADPGYKACREIADLVAAGAKKAEMRYTFVFTPTKLKPYYQRKYARDLYQISIAASQCFHLHMERKEYEKAEKRMQDMFILGWHMFSERAVPDMSVQGMDIMLFAVRRLQELYNVWPDGPTDKIASLRAYENELIEIHDFARQKRKILWDSLPSAVGTSSDQFYPGDVLNMAENEKDRAWKVQAILTLGAMKYRAPSRGDKKALQSLIRQYLGSEDPIIKAAAKCADEMTVQDYQGLGTADFTEEQ